MTEAFLYYYSFLSELGDGPREQGEPQRNAEPLAWATLLLVYMGERDRDEYNINSSCPQGSLGQRDTVLLRAADICLFSHILLW